MRTAPIPPMRARFMREPLAFPGMRIGLFGGTFDPAHSGHAHVAETALKRLRLDAVWWLVTPQNPLKSRQAALLAQRLTGARRAARGRRMVVTDLETRWGLRYSAETLSALRRRYPGVRFVWVMGEDNMSAFHTWRGWRQLVAGAPMAIISRPNVPPAASGARAFARYRSRMRPERMAQALPDLRPPAWLLLHARHNATSSTALRARLEVI